MECYCQGDFFDSPNYPHLADVGIAIRYNTAALLRQKEYAEIEFLPFSEIPIGVLKVFPGIQFGLFEEIVTEKLSGIVLETFGAGNISGGADKLLPIIKRAFSSGAVIAVCSQCPAGTVMLGTYETSASLKSAGAVSGKDVTTEATVTCLPYSVYVGGIKNFTKFLTNPLLCVIIYSVNKGVVSVTRRIKSTY